LAFAMLTTEPNAARFGAASGEMCDMRRRHSGLGRFRDAGDNGENPPILGKMHTRRKRRFCGGNFLNKLNASAGAISFVVGSGRQTTILPACRDAGHMHPGPTWREALREGTMMQGGEYQDPGTQQVSAARRPLHRNPGLVQYVFSSLARLPASVPPRRHSSVAPPS
jgi:hypothetical protein